jgi:hypothetical protein
MSQPAFEALSQIAFDRALSDLGRMGVGLGSTLIPTTYPNAILDRVLDACIAFNGLPSEVRRSWNPIVNDLAALVLAAIEGDASVTPERLHDLYRKSFDQYSYNKAWGFS